VFWEKDYLAASLKYAAEKPKTSSVALALPAHAYTTLVFPQIRKHIMTTLPHNVATCYNMNKHMVKISSKSRPKLKDIRIKQRVLRGNIAQAIRTCIKHI